MDYFKKLSRLLEVITYYLRDVLFQRLMRDKLYEWLVFKDHEGGKRPHVSDNEGKE